MKKLLLVFLMLMVAAVSFAQLRIGLLTDFCGDGLATTRYGGEYSKYDKDNPSVLYLGPGSFNILSLAPFAPHNIGMPKENELKLTVNYTGENFSGFFRVALDNYVRPNTNEPGVINGNGDNFLLDNLFASGIDEWRIEGTIGFFRAWLGRNPNRGVVNRFAAFSELMRFANNDFGVLVPSFTKDASNTQETALINADIDNNNFMQVYSTSGQINNQGTSFFVLSGKFAPFTVSLAGDLGNHSTIGADADIDPEEGQVDFDPYAFIRGNGGIRFSGENIKNLFNFDLIYQLRGGDPTTNKDKATEPNGDAKWMHSIGLYANILGVKDLGIALGYSAMFRTYEDFKGVIVDRNATEELTYSFKSPFWSGINLHFRYTGLQKLTVTFHNNFSFAGVAGENYSLVHPLNYARLEKNAADMMTAARYLGEKEKQNWFALFNGLHLAYRVSSQLTANFMFQNRFAGIKRAYDEKDSGSVTSDVFSSAAFLSCSLGSVLVEGGLTVRNISHNWTADGANTLDGKSVDMKGTISYLAIPLRTRITF
jgi:hypothetical protein